MVHARRWLCDHRAMHPLTVYTCGHSNQSLDEFLDLLERAGIHALVDVRAHPHSRRNPQFDTATLRAALDEHGLEYHWAGRALGGLRTARPGSPHVALDEGFRGFADHMASEEFVRALTHLRNLAARAPTAIMCAERLPEHCHRRFISDALAVQGVTVMHIVEGGARREHALSPELRRESGALIYDRNTVGRLDLQ